MGCDSFSPSGSCCCSVCSAGEEVPESVPQSRDSQGSSKDPGNGEPVKASLAARGANLLIKGYQFISRYTPAVCRFRPTCSEYTRQAILKYGFWRGGLMGAWRILRCNPFNRGGYDPVP